MVEKGGAERVVSSLYEGYNAECFSLCCKIQGREFQSIGTKEEQKEILDRYYGTKEGLEKLKERSEFSEKLADKSEIKNLDKILFHSPEASHILNCTEFEKSIFYNHSASRRYTFLYEFYNDNRYPICSAALDQSIDRIRDFLKKWYEKPDTVISNSKFIKRKTEEYFGVESEVVYPPTDREKFTAKGSEKSGEYYFSYQRCAAAKRILPQIKAFKNLNKKLVIAGKGNYDDYVEILAENIPNIEYVGYLSDEELTQYIRGAKAVITTAYKEDFGLTPIESFACGTPVIAADSGGYKETVKQEVGHRIDVSPENLEKAVRDFDEASYSKSNLRNYSEKFGKKRFLNEIKPYLD